METKEQDSRVAKSVSLGHRLMTRLIEMAGQETKGDFSAVVEKLLLEAFEARRNHHVRD